MDRGPNRTDRLHEGRGFALLVVLWSLALLSAIGVHISARGRTEVYVARNIVANAKAEALADAGTFRAIYALADLAPETRWEADGELRQLAFSDGAVAVVASDVTAKIDPNSTEQKIVAGLFLALDLEPDVARGLAEGIAQAVRSRNPVPASAPAAPGTPPGGDGRRGGAPAPASAASTAPPDGTAIAPDQARRPLAFATVEDLLQIPGMTEKILAKARDYLTVDSGLQKPTLPLAGRIVRRALEIAGERTTSVDRSKTATASAGANPERLTVDIVSSARTKDGAVFIRDAVVRIDPANEPGFAILHWRRRDIPPP
jgi:type II secretory pathway component PulK